MNQRDRDILKGIQIQGGKNGPPATLLGVVVRVSNDYCDIKDTDSEVTFEDVRLRCVITSRQSITLKPKLDTQALALRIEDSGEWVLVHAEELEQVTVNSEQVTVNSELEAVNGNLKIENGKLGVKQGQDTLGKCMQDMLEQIMTLTMPVAGTAAGPPNQATVLGQIKNRINLLISND